MKRIVAIGFPTFILQITGSIQQLILHRKLAQYGGDLALAVVGIIMSITTFLVMPAMGIAQGSQPIIGFNHGARNYKRVKSTLTFSMIWSTAIISLGLIISKIWPSQLIGLFNSNEELISMGVYIVLPIVKTQNLKTKFPPSSS